ncbi:MAG: prepilin-type N-terminal cleavage/methylation domain-containing protein [Bacteroidota bacterium]|nr:prepilin-type N-terminal cleavage/methylation domain-containing protein [Bacteroidota bacterium]MDP3146061.1 prepilin-type N-terminal cleavage/methylation domain-containing protein [Bacteroidota bacterium]
MNINFKKIFKHKTKGLTLAEVLVTLALTSIVITLSYSTLNYTQKLFYNYKKQNQFINEYTDFNKRMRYESLKANTISMQSENTFLINRDSIQTSLQFFPKVILMSRKDNCDTFHIEAKNIKMEYEIINNPQWTNKLVKLLVFETEFTKQKFNFIFHKIYDASVKFELDKEE